MKDILEKIVLHSRLLMPYYFIDGNKSEEEIKEIIEIWKNEKAKGYKFTPGEDVVFIKDPKIRLCVSAIKRTTTNGKKYIVGIECIYVNK